MKFKGFVWLNGPISGATGLNRQILFALDSPAIEEGYQKYYITLIVAL